MFTTTNVAATAAASGGGGPVAAAVPPTFQILTTSVSGSPSSSATTPTTWRLASIPSSSTSLIKQPTVVSIINGSMNVSSSSSSSTSIPLNSSGINIPSHGSRICIATTNPHHYHPVTTTSAGNFILQSPQTVRLVSSPLHSSLSTPTFTLLNNSNMTITSSSRQMTTPLIPSSSCSNNFKPGICIDTPILGLLGPTVIQRQITNQTIVQQSQVVTAECQNTNKHVEEQTNSNSSCSASIDDSLVNNPQDQEIEIFVNNVVCSFALGCKLNLRKIAMEGAHVIYKREQAMVLMKIRNPYCSANVWSSGKVTVTGTTSEDDAKRGARRIARSLQRLGFKTRFRQYRVVNCLATCSLPWSIDIVKLSRLHPEYVSYEPEIHPGATVRLPEKAVLKVFTTGNITLTAPSVDRINTAVNEIYPQLFECRKLDRNGGHH